MSGAFEVSVNGSLVHSKLTIKGHDKCQSALERRRVLAKIKKLVRHEGVSSTAFYQAEGAA